MKMILIDVDENSKRILTKCASERFSQLEVQEKTYRADLFETLRDQSPELIVVDICGWKDYISRCAVGFSHLPQSCFLLLGNDKTTQNQYIASEPVLYIPFGGYFKKPLTEAGMRTALQELECTAPGVSSPMNEDGMLPETDVVSIFQHDLLLTHLFKQEATKREQEHVDKLLGIQPGLPRYFRVFAVEVKGNKNDPMQNNFALFALLHRSIRCKNIVTCSGPVHLIGIISGATKMLLPPGGLEWNILNEWLQNPKMLSKPLFVSLSPVFDTLDKAATAYQCAMTGLQKSFFTGFRAAAENDIPIAERMLNPNAKKIMEDYDLLLLARDRKGLLALAEEFYEWAKQQDIHAIFGIRRLYVRMLYHIYSGEAKLVKTPIPNDLISENTYSLVAGIQTLDALHRQLVSEINGVFNGALRNTTSAEFNTMNILEFIHKNYHDPALTLQMISDGVYLSPSHLSADFKKVVGKPVAKYLNNYRIQQSKYLLANPANRLNWVAHAVGYNDVRQYTKVFKRIEGISPTEYRKRNNSALAESAG